MPNGKFRFGALYGLGSKLQMTPQQINAMSMWQFYAMLSGATEDANALSGEEADELWEWISKGDGE